MAFDGSEPSEETIKTANPADAFFGFATVHDYVEDLMHKVAPDLHPPKTTIDGFTTALSLYLNADTDEAQKAARDNLDAKASDVFSGSIDNVQRANTLLNQAMAGLTEDKVAGLALGNKRGHSHIIDQKKKDADYARMMQALSADVHIDPEILNDLGNRINQGLLLTFGNNPQKALTALEKIKTFTEYEKFLKDNGLSMNVAELDALIQAKQAENPDMSLEQIQQSVTDQILAGQIASLKEQVAQLEQKATTSYAASTQFIATQTGVGIESMSSEISKIIDSGDPAQAFQDNLMAGVDNYAQMIDLEEKLQEQIKREAQAGRFDSAAELSTELKTLQDSMVEQQNVIGVYNAMAYFAETHDLENMTFVEISKAAMQDEDLTTALKTAYGDNYQDVILNQVAGLGLSETQLTEYKNALGTIDTVNDFDAREAQGENIMFSPEMRDQMKADAQAIVDSIEGTTAGEDSAATEAPSLEPDPAQLLVDDPTMKARIGDLVATYVNTHGISEADLHAELETLGIPATQVAGVANIVMKDNPTLNVAPRIATPQATASRSAFPAGPPSNPGIFNQVSGPTNPVITPEQILEIAANTPANNTPAQPQMGSMSS